MVLLALLSRVTLGVILLRVGLLKLAGLEEFKRAVRNYRLVPEFSISAVALGVSLLEFVGGGMLLLGVVLRPVGVVLGALLLGFCLAISVNLARGRPISCGCSGPVAKDITWGHVVSNVCLAVAATWSAVWAAQPLSLVPGLSDPYQGPVWTRRAITALILLSLAGAIVLLSSATRRARRALSRLVREEVR